MDLKNKSIKFSQMKNTVFFLSLVILLIVSSCEKMIDVDQPDTIEQNQAFTDKNSISLSILGIYSLMTDLVEPMFLAGEVRADLVVSSKSAGTYIKEFSNNSFSASNPYISPKPFYTIINNTNNFISAFESLLSENRMDSADFIKYKSELVGIRVWTQYQVAKIFGKCKYYTKELSSGDNSDLEELAFGSELLNKLVSDLQFSDTNIFTSQKDDIVWQCIRFNDFYINALMGELYLDLGDYENAYNKFNEVTSDGDIMNKIPNSANRFNILSKLNNTDWIAELFIADWEASPLLNNAVFMIAFDNKYNQTNELWNWTSSLNYQVTPATWFSNQFEIHTNIDKDNFDYRYYSVANLYQNTNKPYAISKYLQNDRPFIMTRTARIELLKAFCLNAQGINAIPQINRIRKRLNYPDIDITNMPEDDALKLTWIEDKIIEELSYENAFEGQRWYDIMRVALRRNDLSYLANKVAQKYSEESREKLRTELMDYNNWFIPIFE